MKITAFELAFDKLVRPGHLRAVAELARMRPEDLDIGNPNHPLNDGLFGQATDKFLAQQFA